MLKTMSVDLQKNNELAFEEFKNGVVRVISKPPILTIESTSRCNLRCVMCPHAIGAVDRPKDISLPLVEKLDTFISMAKQIQLHGIGEPLTSPIFWDILNKLPTPETCDSSINTNFTLLSDSQLEKIVNSNLQMVSISLDAARTSTYKKIRNADLNKVINNIRKLTKEKLKRKTEHPHIWLNMTLMRSNIEETVEFIQLAKILKADKVRLWHLNRWSENEMSKYIIKRDYWTFNYKKEGLWNHKELSNEMIEKTINKAKELGVNLFHPNNLFFKDT